MAISKSRHRNALNLIISSCLFISKMNILQIQEIVLCGDLANFVRTLALPKGVEHWSPTTIREKLVKIGAKVVAHGRYLVFQLTEVAVPRALFADGPVPDRPAARAARCGSLTKADHGASSAEERTTRRDRTTGLR
jgi:hypothetical protein